MPAAAGFTETAAKFPEKLKFYEKSFSKKNEGGAWVVTLLLQTPQVKYQWAGVGVAPFLKLFVFGRVPFKHFNPT